jgi:2-hydroxychromene-2-carboxylate isomerase
LAKVLAEVPSGFKGLASLSETATALFSPEDVDRIMRATSSEEMKVLLKSTTQEALDRGAFGAPWFWVTNSAGDSEPFFGSDR